MEHSACDLREIDENALEQALSAAVTCTILAGAGPQRSRVLATLYKVFASLVYHNILVCSACYIYMSFFVCNNFLCIILS